MGRMVRNTGNRIEQEEGQQGAGRIPSLLNSSELRFSCEEV
jgi:hypothetical protein